jgi:hypothetical protein
MPQVFKRCTKYRDKNGEEVAHKTETYYARFQIKGQDYCISTGKTTEKEARKEMARLIDLYKKQTTLATQFKAIREAIRFQPAKDEPKGEWWSERQRLLTDHVEPLFMELLQVLPEGQREQQRRRLVKQLQGGQRDKLPLKDGWNAWLQSPNKESTPKQRTLQGYEAVWDRFSGWAKTQSLDYLHEVDERAAGSYTENLWNSHVSPATFNAHVKFLTAMFKALEVKAGLIGNVWAHVTRKAKTVDQGRRNLTEEELRTVMRNAKGNRRVMVALPDVVVQTDASPAPR